MSTYSFLQAIEEIDICLENFMETGDMKDFEKLINSMDTYLISVDYQVRYAIQWV